MKFIVEVEVPGVRPTWESSSRPDLAIKEMGETVQRCIERIRVEVCNGYTPYKPYEPYPAPFGPAISCVNLNARILGAEL